VQRQFIDRANLVGEYLRDTLEGDVGHQLQLLGWFVVRHRSMPIVSPLTR
jgi:hypothetical protein